MDNNRWQQPGLQGTVRPLAGPPQTGSLAYQNAQAVPQSSSTPQPAPVLVSAVTPEQRARLNSLGRPRLGRTRIVLVALITLLLLAMIAPVAYIGIDTVRTAQKQNAANSQKEGGDYNITTIPLSDLVKAGDVTLNNSQININGQLKANNSLVLTPGQAPVNPLTGQFYFSKDSNQLYYFNGNQFVDVATGAQIAQLTNSIATGGLQSLSLGSGLGRNGNQLVNTGVLSLPQELTVTSSPTFGGLNLGSALSIGNGGTGSTTAAGARINLGVAASGANTDITSLGALSAISPTAGVTYSFNADAPGTYQFCTTAGNCATAGALTGSGTAGRIAKFTSGQVLADSLLSEAASTVTVNGSLAVTGTVSGNGSGLTSLSASNVSSGTLTDNRLSSNVALLNRNNQVFTGANQIFRNATNSGNALQVQDASGNNVFNVDAITHDITTDWGNLYINALDTVSPTLTSSSTGGTLSAGTYYYRVSAYNAGGQLSGAIDTTPASATTTGSTSRNTLSWPAVSGAAGYYIYRSTDAGATYRRVNVGNVTSAIDNGTNYTWSGGDYSGDKWFNFTGNIYLEHGAGLNLGSGNLQVAEDLRGELEIANYNTGSLVGGVAVYSDYFGVYDTTDYHTNLYMDRDGKATFSNRLDSTGGFLVQDAAGSNLLVVDTLNQQLAVGLAAVPANSVLTVGSDTTAASGGITLGTDTNLYRSGSGALKTDGSFQAAGSGAFGNAATVNDSGTERSTLIVKQNYTSLTGINYLDNLTSSLTVNADVNSTATLTANYNELYAQGTKNYGQLNGGYSYVESSTSGTVNSLIAQQGFAYNYASSISSDGIGMSGQFYNEQGTVVNAIGLQGSVGSAAGTNTNSIGVNAVVGNHGGGTVTNGYGLRVQSAVNDGGGVFTNNYGVYIQDQSAVGSTNSYNLYSAGANAKNYLAGKLQVGSSNTTSRVNIGADTDTTSAGGITFGTDTNLYRGAANQLKTDDTVQIKTTTNSTSAFQVQNASGTALLTADTTNMVLTVQALAVTGNLTVNGHLVTGGSTPTTVVNANAGVGASCTVSGTDTAGTITVTTGSSGVVAGTQCAITFASAFGSAPRVVLGASNAGAAPLDPYVASTATGSFSIGVGTAGANSTAYKFDYITAQ